MASSGTTGNAAGRSRLGSCIGTDDATVLDYDGAGRLVNLHTQGLSVVATHSLAIDGVAKAVQIDGDAVVDDNTIALDVGGQLDLATGLNSGLEVCISANFRSGTPCDSGQAQCHDESQNQGYELFHDPFLQKNRFV